MTRIAVLGAGIQGACVALAASGRGYEVVLIDQAGRSLDRASLRNEGKIHLGHVYANDPSFETAELMLRSALSFGPLLDRWLPGGVDWESIRSNTFFYLVARDSLASDERLVEHYTRVGERARELQRDDRALHYLGRRLTTLHEPQSLPETVDSAAIRTSFDTPEVSIDLGALRRAIEHALADNDRVELRYGHRIDTVSHLDHGFSVDGTTPDRSRWTVEADIVVNALWDGRLAIDEQLGLLPERQWVHRLKHRVVGRTPRSLAGLPSFTIVLGAFGDVVTRPDDDSVYLSWYPACMTGWSQSVTPPASWSDALSGDLAPEEQAPIIEDTLAAFDRLIPGLGATTDTYADGGVIFSWGDSDIDDQQSELHRRNEIGLHHHDGYISIDTGKLTSAPLFAARLAELLP